MLNVSQSLLHLDQYRFGIKSPVLLYSCDYSMILITTYNSINSIDYTATILQLETALCYQHYFCNTELRTAIITEIKGLSIQTQQNTFVLFTLFKLTSDEHKTLTKVSTRKTSHNHSPNQCTLRTRRNKKTCKQPNKEKEEKAVCMYDPRVHFCSIPQCRAVYLRATRETGKRTLQMNQSSSFLKHVAVWRNKTTYK